MSDNIIDEFVFILEELLEFEEEAEKFKGFWDNSGLALYIAVIEYSSQSCKLAFSTKHWWRVYYIEVHLDFKTVWAFITKVCNDIGRSLVKKDEQINYVYIPKLNEIQTNDIFERLIDEIRKTNSFYDVVAKWQFRWNIKGAKIP